MFSYGQMPPGIGKSWGHVPRLSSPITLYKYYILYGVTIYIYFIVPNVLFISQFQFYLIKISLPIGRHSKWMSHVAMTLLRMPLQPPLVSLFEPYAHISRAVDIFSECHPLYISFTKTVWNSKIVARSIDQSDHWKLTWGIIIWHIWNWVFVIFPIECNDDIRMISIISNRMITRISQIRRLYWAGGAFFLLLR